MGGAPILEVTSAVGDAERQLRELLADAEYRRTLEHLGREIERRWNRRDGYQVMLSAIGEPRALASIHAAVRANNRPLAYLISRRRALDLLRRDTGRPDHEPLEGSHIELASDHVLPSRYVPQADGSEARIVDGLERERVRGVLREFAKKNRITARQASLLRRRILEEASYHDLARELKTGPGSVRLRFFSAKRAFRRFVELRYPGLRVLLVVRRVRRST
jgi:DNA-directed RNA polymerase specialized sigma24 family protein